MCSTYTRSEPLAIVRRNHPWENAPGNVGALKESQPSLCAGNVLLVLMKGCLKGTRPLLRCDEWADIRPGSSCRGRAVPERGAEGLRRGNAGGDRSPTIPKIGKALLHRLGPRFGKVISCVAAGPGSAIIPVSMEMGGKQPLGCLSRRRQRDRGGRRIIKRPLRFTRQSNALQPPARVCSGTRGIFDSFPREVRKKGRRETGRFQGSAIRLDEARRHRHHHQTNKQYTKVCPPV